MIRAIILTSILGMAAAECPNACSGHGTCTTFDMCTCDRNWQAADCSQRTCPFELAHVDTPKGDLDHSNSISNSGTTAIVSSTVYPKGTQEGFPKMVDGAGTAQSQTGHYYMECSNKGICDRKTGECECFDGYDGAACQRASCPNDCSGHGTCESISTLAAAEFSNVYALWDKDVSMGCKCDSSYSGPDCSSRTCVVGSDPLYLDDTTARVTSTGIRISASAADISGTYALKFFDWYGEDYTTEPIVGENTFSSSCTNIVSALQALPDDVISSVTCSGATAADDVVTSHTNGVDLVVTFTGNPGYLKQLEVDYYLDGSRATLSGSNLVVATYSKVVGEDTDYFATKCSGVSGAPTVQGTWTDAFPGTLGYFDLSSDATKAKLLKACLGDSDGNTGNNVEVYNWDYGSLAEYVGNNAADGVGTAVVDNVIGTYPHAIKTVPTSAVAGTNTVGEFHLLWYDTLASSGQEFRLANLPTTDAVASYVYTTDGVVQQLGVDEQVNSAVRDNEEFDAQKNETRVVGYFSKYSNTIYTNLDASCESGGTTLMNCIQKGDKLFIVDGCWGAGTMGRFFGGQTKSCAASTNANRNTGNLYTVTKIYSKPYTATTIAWNADSTTKMEDRYVITVDQNIGWKGNTMGSPGMDSVTDPDGSGTASGIVILFKFTPATTGNYKWVATCSNRGACDSETGLCSCFKGYTGNDCSTLSALAV